MPQTLANPSSLGAVDPVTGEVVSASTIAAATLTTACSIVRQRDSGAHEGGVDDIDTTENRETVWSGFCRIERPSAYRETAAGDVVQSVTKFVGLFPLSAPAHPPYQVEAAGQTFEIRGNDLGVSDAALLTVILEKVT